MNSLDDMLGTSSQEAKAPVGEEFSLEDASKPTDNDLSYTEKLHKDSGKKMIGVKNVSDRKGVHRGINFPIPVGNGNVVTVKPGHAVALEEPIWKKIRNTRNTHGDLAFEEVDLKECDVNPAATRATDQPFDPTNEVDDNLIETIFLAIKSEAHEETIELMTTCQSIATLQFVMREIDKSNKLPVEVKNRYNKFLVQRISALRKTNMR